jgi:putative MATE family efflux protein
MMGAGSTIGLGLDYGNVLFAGSIFIVFSSTAYGILRAEGNVSKTTYAMLFGAVLNMILDPIFIYSLKLGVTGAAVATLMSLAAVCVLLVYWFKTDTYIKFSLRSFVYNNDLIKKLLGVGLPAGTEFLIIAILSGSLNMILITVAGVNGVAVYTAGWRVVMVALVPPIAIGTSIVAVTGAAFGAKKYKDIDIIHKYSIKIGLILVISMAVAIFILAPYISYIFTYSPESNIQNLITDFLRVTAFFYLTLPIGISSASIFQGVGKGLDSLIIVVLRILILEVFFAYLLAIPLGFGQQGVWWGIVIGNACGATFAYFYSRRYINKLNRL